MSSFTEEELAAAAWRRNLKLAEKLSREGERGRAPRRMDEWKEAGRRDCSGYEKASQSRWAEQGRGRSKKIRRRAYSGEEDEEKGDVDEFGRMRRTGSDDGKKSETTSDGVYSSHCRNSERGRSCSRSRSNSEEDRRRRSRSRERREHRQSRSRSQERVRNGRYFVESADKDYRWDRKQPWANSNSQNESQFQSSWSHDKFDDIDRQPSPPRNIESNYRPPNPSWQSRAGGVYLPMRKPQETADDVA